MENGNITLKPTALIVENNLESADIIKYSLTMQGIECIVAATGNEAIKIAKIKKIDVAIINFNMPIISGMGLCAILKSKYSSKDILILYISKKDNGLDEIKGGDKSFDDYILLPFATSNLILKVTDLIKKKYPKFEAVKFNHGDLSLDPGTAKVFNSGKEIRLGPVEIRILQCFMGNPRKIFTREEILMQVWGSSNKVDPRTVDVHINRLRSSMNNESIIKTIRTWGYTLERKNQ